MKPFSDSYRMATALFLGACLLWSCQTETPLGSSPVEVDMRVGADNVIGTRAFSNDDPLSVDRILVLPFTKNNALAEANSNYRAAPELALQMDVEQFPVENLKIRLSPLSTCRLVVLGFNRQNYDFYNRAPATDDIVIDYDGSLSDLTVEDRAAGNNSATGTYTGTVVFSAVGNAAAMADCANIATGFTSGCTDNNVTVRMPSQATAGGAYNPATGGMVPVIFNDHDSNPNTAPQVVVKATTDADWYNYAQKQWANAVTFSTAANRTLASGTVLSQAQINDIIGYWTYVPRYEYRLINTGFDGVSTCGVNNPQFCPQAFEIRFVNTTVATKVGTAIGDWHSHR